MTRLCIIHLTQEVITHVLTMEAFENRTTMEQVSNTTFQAIRRHTVTTEEAWLPSVIFVDQGIECFQKE